MLFAGLALFLLAFIVSLMGTFLARRFARRLGLMDAPGERKVHSNPTPRNGGIGIFWGFALPLLGAILFVITFPFEGYLGDPSTPAPHWMVYGPGMRAHAALLASFLAATFLIHLVGLFDDAKPMKPWPKLLLQIGIAAALVIVGEFVDPVRGGAFRILTSIGFVPSTVLSVLWIVALTNAFNFLDHMDGLSAGVAFICAATFLIAVVFNGQWFVAGLLLAFMGAVLGFLCLNFPPASIFMGDGGSTVLGFILAVLTIRTTYYDVNRKWYSVLMPLFVMAVPLYDLLIVFAVRISRGRSVMHGDTNHFSHRLVRAGFSKRNAVLVIYGVTLATGITAPLLARVDDTSALLLAGQLLGMLVVIGVLERVGERTQ